MIAPLPFTIHKTAFQSFLSENSRCALEEYFPCRSGLGCAAVTCNPNFVLVQPHTHQGQPYIYLSTSPFDPSDTSTVPYRLPAQHSSPFQLNPLSLLCISLLSWCLCLLESVVTLLGLPAELDFSFLQREKTYHSLDTSTRLVAVLRWIEFLYSILLDCLDWSFALVPLRGK